MFADAFTANIKNANNANNADEDNKITPTPFSYSKRVAFKSAGRWSQQSTNYLDDEISHKTTAESTTEAPVRKNRWWPDSTSVDHLAPKSVPALGDPIFVSEIDDVSATKQNYSSRSTDKHASFGT